MEISKQQLADHTGQLSEKAQTNAPVDLYINV